MSVEAPLSERERALMIALWWAVKAAGGEVLVTADIASGMVFGVDKIDQIPDGKGNLILRCIR